MKQMKVLHLDWQKSKFPLPKFIRTDIFCEGFQVSPYTCQSESLRFWKKPLADKTNLKTKLVAWLIVDTNKETDHRVDRQTSAEFSHFPVFHGFYEWKVCTCVPQYFLALADTKFVEINFDKPHLINKTIVLALPTFTVSILEFGDQCL